MYKLPWRTHVKILTGTWWILHASDFISQCHLARKNATYYVDKIQNGVIKIIFLETDEFFTTCIVGLCIMLNPIFILYMSYFHSDIIICMYAEALIVQMFIIKWQKG